MQQIFLQCARGVFVALFLMATNNVNANSLLRHIFGAQTVSPEIQKVADLSDQMTNFDTTVFKMNGLAKKIGYSSFNWFNTTWVDEEVVQHKTDKAILWQLIHEKYHTIAGHDWRRIIGVGAVVMPIIQGIMLSIQVFIEKGDSGISPFILPNALPATFLALFLFLWHEEYCESQADAYANWMMHEGVVNA